MSPRPPVASAVLKSEVIGTMNRSMVKRMLFSGFYAENTEEIGDSWIWRRGWESFRFLREFAGL